MKPRHDIRCANPRCNKYFSRTSNVQRFCRRSCARRMEAARRTKSPRPAPPWKVPRPCVECGAKFLPQNESHARCSKECRAAWGRRRALDYYYAVKAEAAEPDEPPPPPPRLACPGCANWRPLPSVVSELGGYCGEEVFRACDPWGPAHHLAPPEDARCA